MNLNNNIITAFNTVIDNKKQLFDRTIQAIVKDNSDPNKIGEIKVSYKDAVLPVYTDLSTVKNYPKGSHVYVTVPNNNMSARKTVLGLVEKIGPLVVMDNLDTYSLDSRYASDNNLKFEDLDFVQSQSIINGWSYVKEGEEWYLYNKVSGSKIIGSDEVVNFFEVLKTFALQSDSVRFRSNVTTLLLPEQSNLPSADYGIEIDFYFQKENGEDIFESLEEAKKILAPIKVRMNIDQMVGDPYLQSEQEQYVIIDTSRIVSELQLKKINFFYYRKNFPLISEQDEANITFSNFILEAVTQMQQEETSDLTMYITTPKGKSFLPQIDNKKNISGKASDTLTLNAVIKENGVQLDNTSLICYWYEKDSSYESFAESVQKDLDSNLEAIYDFAGGGWRLISVDDENVPYSCNPWTVSREDLYGLVEKEYKVISFYSGNRLSATVKIQNLNTESIFNIEVTTSTNETGKFYNYRLVKSITNDNNIESDIRWYYVPDGGTPKLLRTISSSEGGASYSGFSSRDRLNIQLKENTFKYNGQIMCEVYRQVKGQERLYTTLLEVYNANIIDNVLFYNFEQVFLYDVDGKLNLITEENKENKYSIAYRPVSIVGKVSQIQWRIPMDFFEQPERVDQIDSTERFYIVNNILSLSGLKIKTIYPKFNNSNHCPLHENIVVDFIYNGEKFRKTTNFSFVQEGMDGTNGSGIFCRVVPNIDDDNSFIYVKTGGQDKILLEPHPNTIILEVKPQRKDSTTDDFPLAMFNFLPVGVDAAKATQMLTQRIGAVPFKIQLWKKNQKIFDGAKKDTDIDTIQNISWRLFEATNDYFYMGASNGLMRVENLFSTFDNFVEFHNWLKLPQGLTATVKYQNVVFKYTLPFLTLGAATVQLNSFYDFWNLCSFTFSNPYGTYSLASYAKFYYNEDGKYNTDFGYNNGNNSYIHYEPSPLLFTSKGVTFSNLAIRPKDPVPSHFNFIFDANENKKKTVTIGASQNFSTEEENRDVIYYQDAVSLASYSLPLCQILNPIDDAFVTDWDGQTVNISDNTGAILAQNVAAGFKNADNTFTGGILGFYNGKTGLTLYNGGSRTMYLDANGKIEIGSNPASRLLEDGSTQIISNGLTEGLRIDLAKGELQYNYLGSIVTAEEEEDQTDTKQAIQLIKNKEILFQLSENGVLEANTIIGNEGDKDTWGVLKGGEVTYKNLKRDFFVQSSGIAGLKELYIDSQMIGPNTNQLDGVWIRKTGLGHLLINSTSSNNTNITKSALRGGFVLDEKGLCIADANGTATRIQGGKINATQLQTNTWIQNSFGITNEKRTVAINENEAILPSTRINGTLSAGQITADNGVSENHYVRMKNGDTKIFCYSRGILTDVQPDDVSDGYGGLVTLVDKDGNEIILEFSGGNLRAVY